MADYGVDHPPGTPHYVPIPHTLRQWSLERTG